MENVNYIVKLYTTTIANIEEINRIHGNNNISATQYLSNPEEFPYVWFLEKMKHDLTHILNKSGNEDEKEFHDEVSRLAEEVSSTRLNKYLTELRKQLGNVTERYICSGLPFDSPEIKETKTRMEIYSRRILIYERAIELQQINHQNAKE